MSEPSDTADAAEALAAAPVFSALTPVDRAKLAAWLEERWLDAGEAVFEAGAAGDALYIVRSGLAERRAGGSPIGTIGVHEIFGELAVLTDEPRSASVVAITPLRLWVLPRARFRQLLQADPELTLHLTAATGQRLAQARRALGELQRELDTWVATLMDALESDDRRLVEAAAVLDAASRDVLARVTGIPPDRAAERLLALAGRSPLVHGQGQALTVPPAIRGALLRRVRAEGRLAPLAARLRAAAESLAREGRTADAALVRQAASGHAEEELAGPGLAAGTSEVAPVGAPANRSSEGRAGSGWGRILRSRATWMLVALLPLLAWNSPPSGLAMAGWRVLLTLISAAVLFAADALPDAVVALALLGTWAMTGLVPPRAALDGFASQTWLLVLTVLSVGVAVANTGLLYRAALAALARAPRRFGPRCATLALVGVAVTPALPNATSRVALAAPLVRELAEALGYEPSGPAAAGLGLAALVGFGQMSALFLTGSSVGLLVHGLLPEEMRARLGFGHWFLAALPMHLVLLGLALGVILLLYRPTEALPAGDRLALQRAMLGPMRRDEVLCLIVLAALIAGFLTEPLHRVNGAWLGVAALVALAAGGVLDAGRLRNGVNWNFLVFFGVITSLAGVFGIIGIDAWLAHALAAPLRVLPGGAGVFCLALTLAGFALAFVVRWQAAAPLLTLVALPASDPTGVHPVVAALIALVATQVWFLPYQSTVYLALYHGSGELFSHRAARRLALLWGPIVLASVAAAIPVWRWMNLLR